MIPFGITSVWCFLFVTLFNLQGTRRIRRSLLIIPNFISFVKYFFQSFLTADPFVISSNLFKITHREAFVKYFFQVFQKLSIRILPTGVPAGQLG